MRRARYRRWTQPSLPLRPSTADPAQGPQTAVGEASARTGRFVDPAPGAAANSTVRSSPAVAATAGEGA